MKNILIISIFLFSLNCLGEIIPLKPEFLNTLGKQESSNNAKAIGDNKKAIGIYQIHLKYWQDATDFDKTINGSYSDCFNPDYAKRIVTSYLNKYAKSAIQKNDFEKLARIHNGGPLGYKNPNTIKYWKRFKNNR